MKWLRTAGVVYDHVFGMELCNTWLFKFSKGKRASGQVIIVIQGHSRVQRSRQCVLDLLDRTRISDGRDWADGTLTQWTRGQSIRPINVLQPN
ncbi:hypothetical protein EVAR_44521_1 [Eumeta japonica]|uniref:Uncharacterized protein n=1 Tax=Eumeta variegata TaxID=151549 RepID=A0A4C1YJ76_EUMVA|nr:hypothetical protein EVAR_44521_1 [Eumeta japonica]